MYSTLWPAGSLLEKKKFPWLFSRQEHDFRSRIRTLCSSANTKNDVTAITMVYVTTPARAGIFMKICDELTYLPKNGACFLTETFLYYLGMPWPPWRYVNTPSIVFIIEFTYNFCQQLFQLLEASAIKMLLCKKISLLILLFVSGEDPGDKQ